jgi:transposase
VTATSKERLQMLDWLKTNALATRKERSQRLNRNESTVYRWLKHDEQGGREALLDVKTPPGKLSLIPTQVMNQLLERLSQPQRFKSYGQIQEWLNQECQVVVAYKTVQKIVRYKLNAKLKVPRPRSVKAVEQVQEALKKNCQT